ncbi:hypothetical protein PENSPDRAFT_593162 [Peniophora sp. CONT]|nr:hypothetical protein PENSPDRAFT_593162 [Peniophora sp. CONT]
MRHFAEQNLAPKYAQLIIAFRYAPPPHLRCSVCKRASVGRWRCAHCVGLRDYCTGCLRQSHANHPFHFVGWWTGQHYRRAWLRDAGVCIQLCPNTGPGECCPANPGLNPDLSALDEKEPKAYGKSGKSAIPTTDMFGFRTLVVAHIDGIHGLGVGFCKCEGHVPEDEQLLRYGGLYPASQDRPSTAFTLQFLEYRHVDDVVCKTTAQAHMRKIRRCTEPDEPRLAPNRYGETLVVSRQYECIKNLVDLGYASQPLQGWKAPPAGGLVWKCVVCPRMTPEFNNLPKAWQDDPEEWRKFVSLAYDGNFSGDHTISRRPGNNVPLFPGTGMFEHPATMEKHMEKAVDNRDLRRMDPSLCHDHRAAAGVGKTRSKVVDIKGIGSWACSRHGCFCAGATNNFTLGESQHPVDKSLSNAFHHTITQQITRVQLLYDIWCRYGVHVRERFRQSGLDWPKFRELLQGVGVWHIYGHVFECLRRFSPGYSPRSGIVDGEILETLWSLLNAILQSCRGMSLAAREEKINTHMNDINYRKIIEMGKTTVLKSFMCLRSLPQSVLS